MLIDFSEVEQEINEAPAPRILSKGDGAEVRIIAVNEGVSTNGENAGCRWFMPKFDVPSDPMVKEFTVFFWNPLDNKKINGKNRQKNNYALKQFFACFKIDTSTPFAFEDLIGKTGWIIAGVSNNKEYGDQNFIYKYVVDASDNSDF